MKIAFFGLGGVGGYMAAHMAHLHRENKDIEFYFIARGKHLEAVKKQGLELQLEDGTSIVVHPTLATNNTSECPKMDYVVYATKSYSIEESIDQLAQLCNEHTSVITFMNGVDGFPKLKAALPQCKVYEGCVYIFSWIESPGVIKEKGNFSKYFIGSSEPSPELEAFYMLAKDALRSIELSSDISKRVWWKYGRISAFATVTCHHNITSGEVKDTQAYLEEYTNLTKEYVSIAVAMGMIEDDGATLEGNLQMLEISPASATSSMQRDYHAGKQCELESLTGYISKKGKELGIPTPTYDKAYQDMLKGQVIG